MTDQTQPAGWYQDPADPTAARWFDGTQWTNQTQPLSPQQPPTLADDGSASAQDAAAENGKKPGLTPMRLVLIAAVAVVAGLAAWVFLLGGGGEDPAAAADAVSTPTPTAEPTPDIKVTVDISAVQVTDKDVPGYKVAVVNDDLAPASLSNCGFTFTSEGMRVSQQGVAVLDKSDKPIGLINNVIVYESADAAAQAVDEWRTSAKECAPGTEVAIDGQTVSYTVTGSAASSSLPVKNNEVTTETTTSGDVTVYSAIVLQQEGRVVAVTSLQTPSKKPSQGALEATGNLAKKIGDRMIDLASSGQVVLEDSPAS